MILDQWPQDKQSTSPIKMRTKTFATSVKYSVTLWQSNVQMEDNEMRTQRIGSLLQFSAEQFERFQPMTPARKTINEVLPSPTQLNNHCQDRVQCYMVAEFFPIDPEEIKQRFNHPENHQSLTNHEITSNDKKSQALINILQTPMSKRELHSMFADINQFSSTLK